VKKKWGRDFETFAVEHFDGSVEQLSLPEHPIAFACSIQKDKINSKIREDVRSISVSGPQFGTLHYFCTTDLPVAKRHALQRWARTSRSIELHIYDGQAVACPISTVDYACVITPPL